MDLYLLYGNNQGRRSSKGKGKIYLSKPRRSYTSVQCRNSRIGGEGVGSSVWGRYITVQWSGMNTSLMPIDSTYQHMEQELEVISSAKENKNDT